MEIYALLNKFNKEKIRAICEAIWMYYGVLAVSVELSNKKKIENALTKKMLL